MSAALIDRPTTTMRQHIHLVPRRMRWDFSGIPACPVEGDPNLAAFVLAVSYFVVAFEDFGIPVVREALPELEDFPALKREAQAFITQEALHSQGHVLLNNVMTERHGIDRTRMDREFRRFMRDIGAGSQQDRLAAVAGLEHVIFSVAQWYETTPEVRRKVHPELDRLMLWHCMEETEHTAVVYDMYRHIYGGGLEAYRKRMAAYARGIRVGVRTLVNAWKSLVPQMASRMGAPASRLKPPMVVTAEASKYVYDVLRFLAPGFTPWAGSDMARLLPDLRRDMRPAWQDAADWIEVEVASVTDVAADVRAYELKSSAGRSLPEWSPGAHVDVEIETGVVRQYSLCGAAGERAAYRIAARREVAGRGGSLRLHQEIREGSTLRIGRPRNLFELDVAHAARGRTILLAGGIGITPLLAMARCLDERGADFVLHMCGRDAEHLPFAAEAVRWPFAARVRQHLDRASPGRRVDVAGLVPPWEASRPARLYVCGPAPFIDAARAAASARGWPEDAVRFERFVQDAGAGRENRAFTVRLGRRGLELTVASNQTILEAIEARGLRPASSCREGVCGSCVCGVVAGEVDHRDAILADREHHDGRQIAICVSRARGDSLTLDL